MAAVVVVVAVAVAGGVGSGRTPVAGAAVPDDPEVDYAPPVDAPVVDPFRPPPRPWLPGNRGIEYATGPGTVVRAAGRGTVTFAGVVAGSRHVTVTHPDGVRTSYSFLAQIRVVAGQAVARGTVVGRAGSRLHVGARRGATYIDPASLWSRGPPWVRLAPLDGARLHSPVGPATPVGPRSHLTARSTNGRPPGRQGRATSNRWERRSTWINPS